MLRKVLVASLAVAAVSALSLPPGQSRPEAALRSEKRQSD